MTDLDPRLNAFRPDLADRSLEGRVQAARYVAGRPAQVIQGVVGLRRRPDAAAPLDTQLLSGEEVRVFEEAGGWAWVQNRADGYVGYVPGTALGSTVVPPTHTVKVLRSFLFPRPDLKAPPVDCLTMSGGVAVLGQSERFSRVRVGAREGWVTTRHLAATGEVAPDYVATALRFLGAPYLWGGKESLGVDCSGLIQVALHRAGMECPRDAGPQARYLGQAVAREPGGGGLRRGDLVYFPGHAAIALDQIQVLNANAHAMLVTIEPLSDVEKRVTAESGGQGVTAVRRPGRRSEPPNLPAIE